MQYRIDLARNRAGSWELVIVEKHPDAKTRKRIEARRLITVIDSPAQDLLLSQLHETFKSLQKQLAEAREQYV